MVPNLPMSNIGYRIEFLTILTTVLLQPNLLEFSFFFFGQVIENQLLKKIKSFLLQHE